MKKNKNKKFYNFTEKQKRKDRTVSRDLPSASFRKDFNDEYKAKRKQVLIKILQGKNVEFPIFVKNIGWWYW